MADTTASNATTKGLIDVYDEEFFTNLEIAKNLVNQIQQTTEKEICKKWISKLCSLKSADPVVKKNPNGFFKCMLQILHKAVEPQIKADQFPLYDEEGHEGEEGGEKKMKDFMSRWSPDRRTYIAAEPMPGLGALVYMATTKDPSLESDHPHLR